MTVKTPVAWSVAASLVLLVLIGAGCGGEDDGEAPAEDSAAEAPQRPGSDEPESDAGPDRPSDASRRVLEACRDLVQRAPGLSDDVKRRLIAECEEAASDDEEAARRAASAACDAIAAATVPGPLRGPAAAACRRAIPSGNLF